jgi:uncharacterized membrane protein YcaP (DUF421 family)
MWFDSRSDRVTALALPVALRFLVGGSSTRSGLFRRAVTSEPVVLVWKGYLQPEAIEASRLVVTALHQESTTP